MRKILIGEVRKDWEVVRKNWAEVQIRESGQLFCKFS